MPIQRQSDQFAAFDDGPRRARDRSDTDMPKGLAGLVNSMGPRISGGMLNTRTAGWHTPDYDPRVDGYGQEDPTRIVPDASDFAEEDAERARKRDYPRGYGPAWDEDSNYPDPDLENLEETADPDRFLPGGHVSYRRRGSGRLPFDRAAARRFLAFDWHRHIDAPDLEYHKAPLENGHELHAWQHRGPEGTPDGWNWAISDPSGTPHGELSEWSHPEEYGHISRGGRDAPLLSEDDGVEVASDDYIGSLDEAKQQAQEHYQKLFPVGGTGTGGHDSGIDYSDLNSFDINAPIDPSKLSPHNPDEYGPRLAGYDSPGVDAERVVSGPLVDSPLYDQDPDDYFGRQPYSGPHCPDCGRPTRYISGPNCRHSSLHTAGALGPDQQQMQAPIAGGYQPGHRVQLQWRPGSHIPGTVIGLANEGPQIRWDDGQYSTEEPRNIQLL